MANPFSGSSIQSLELLKIYKRLMLKKATGLSSSEAKELVEIEKKLAKILDYKNKDGAHESRSSLRVKANFELNIESSSQLKRVLMKNISGGGIYLETQDLKPIGTKLQIAFRLPNEDTWSLEVEVAWVNVKDLGEIRKGMGVKFLNLTTDQRRKLDHFIAAQVESQLKEPR